MKELTEVELVETGGHIGDDGGTTCSLSSDLSLTSSSPILPHGAGGSILVLDEVGWLAIVPKV